MFLFKESNMIRFIAGLFLCMGAVGGLEQDTMTFAQFFMFAGIGLGLMFWAVPSLATQASD